MVQTLIFRSFPTSKASHTLSHTQFFPSHPPVLMLGYQGRQQHCEVIGAIASSAHHIEQSSSTTVIIHGSNAAYTTTSSAWNCRNVRTQPPGSPHESLEIALILPIRRRSSDIQQSTRRRQFSVSYQTTGDPINLLNEISMTPCQMSSPKHILKSHACFAFFQISRRLCYVRHHKAGSSSIYCFACFC